MRKKIIAGNWKMYKTAPEALELVAALKKEIGGVTAVDVVVCPPFVHLGAVVDNCRASSIAVGAQNIYWEDAGAFTGEVSGPMLASVGVKYVIIGHSERRQFFGETNETVNKRTRAALKNGLKPIVCVGENLAERESGRTFDVIRDHVTGSLAGLTKEDMLRIVLAYEPVWAIGTGKTASAAQAQEVHKFIREILLKMFDKATADATRIQYGGSVKPENIAELVAQPDIDGALVGGASLKADSFAALVRNSMN
ncbi:MAG: triose-phosphate isomerase [Candidatus Omnitrophica bacterium]|nr:triose-phosphate isomerase [Candidatus Omnitrophota bacterium]